MKARRKYARIGEKVRVIANKDFERCGYPLTTLDIQNKYSKEIAEMVDKIGAAIGVDIWSDRSRLGNCLHKGLASYFLNKDKFGGPERKIYERDRAEYEFNIAGKEGIVTARKFVKTGTRIPGHSYTSYEGERDYDPPYLHNEKTHCIYTLEIVGGPLFPVNVPAENTSLVSLWGFGPEAL